MYGICQRCASKETSWNVHQAEFHVGQIQHWKVQLCRECEAIVEQSVLSALRPPQAKSSATGGEGATP